MFRRPPTSTPTDTLFPYTTLCRSAFAIGAEAGAGDHRDAGLLQQSGLQRLGAHTGPLDIGEGVERAAGLDAAEARDLVQLADDHPAPLVERRDHRMQIGRAHV